MRAVLIVIIWKLFQTRYPDLNLELDINLSVQLWLQIYNRTHYVIPMKKLKSNSKFISKYLT